MYFRTFGHRRKLVHHHWQRCGFGKSNRHLHVLLRRVAVPFLITVLVVMTFPGAPARLVLDRLFLQVVERFVHRGDHIPGLSKANQRSISRTNRDLRLVAMLLHGKNHLGLELVT